MNYNGDREEPRSMIKRIGVLGAGAIGSVVGGMLTRAGHDVTLIDQWPEHVEAMRARGLRLSGTIGDFVVPVKALHMHELQTVGEPFDAVFVRAVKSYDTEWATAMALPYLREPNGVIIDFQNGINDDRVAKVAGRHRSLGCVITISAGMDEPGHAMRTDTASIGFKIGEHDGAETPRARELATIMGAVAETKVTTNLWGERSSKLAINCMANPLSGLTGLGTLKVRTVPEIAAVGVHLGAEAITRAGVSATRWNRSTAFPRSATSTRTAAGACPSCWPTSPPWPARAGVGSRACSRTC